MGDVTAILSAIEQGDQLSADHLLTLVYTELRRLAERKMAHEPLGQTLNATALVHEAYVRLVDTANVQQWNSKGHFFAAAAEAMRRILVERARHKQSLKAGGELHRHDMTDIEPGINNPDLQLLDLNDVLDKLELQDKRKADLVKLRFFAGLSIDEAAEVLGISPSTANNDWAFARCWLRLEIDDGRDGSPAKR